MLLNNLKKFSALSAKERAFFVEAYITLGFMRAVILSLSFKRLTRTLEQSTKNETNVSVQDAQMQTAMTIAKVISKAANHTPWESTCLTQSLTVHRMLNKRGIPGLFYLGAAKDESVQDKMKAHSWSQCGSTILTGENGHEEFTVLSVFKWSKQ